MKATIALLDKRNTNKITLCAQFIAFGFYYKKE